MKEIKLTQNQVAFVDDEDYERVMNAGKWSAVKSRTTFYAKKNYSVNGKKKSILLHTFILGEPEEGFEIDHKKNNGLDCTKDNLRFVTRSQNAMNRRKKENYSSSIYKGVSFYKPSNKWRAQIKINKILIHLGYYDDPKQGAEAYNLKAIELFGEYAHLNKIFPN